MVIGSDLQAVGEFAAQWAGKGYEKGECQKFWTLLLRSLRFLETYCSDWIQNSECLTLAA